MELLLQRLHDAEDQRRELEKRATAELLAGNLAEYEAAVKLAGPIEQSVESLRRLFLLAQIKQFQIARLPNLRVVRAEEVPFESFGDT